MYFCGDVRNVNWAWTGGQYVYPTGFLGGKSQTPPSESGDLVQAAALALGADWLHVEPDKTIIEVS
ncbi:hypothetical protein ACFL0D_06905 [Thermoproteota archaeon]